MRIEQLQYFSEIARTQSFTLASEKLFIAQPSLSESIKSLEKELGYTLFQRSRTGAVLTPKGEQIYPIVQRILKDVAAIRSLKESPQDYTHPACTLEVESVSYFEKLFTQVLAAFNQDYPELLLTIHQNDSKSITTNLLNGHGDLGLFSVFPELLPAIDPEIFHLHLLFSRHIHLIVHKSSALARKKAISLALAQQQTYSLLAFGPELITMDYLFKNMTMPQIVFKSTSFNLTLNHIKNHHSVGLFFYSPDSTRPNLSEEFKLVPLKENFVIDFYSLYSKSLPPEKLAAITLFLEALNSVKNV